MKQKLWINNNAEDRTYMLEKTEESHPGVGQAAIYFFITILRYYVITF